MGNDSVEKCEMTLGFNLKKKKAFEITYAKS